MKTRAEILSDRTLELWFEGTPRWNELLKEEEDEDLNRAIDEIEAEGRVLDEDRS